jgi:hypothetical protein
MSYGMKEWSHKYGNTLRQQELVALDQLDQMVHINNGSWTAGTTATRSAPDHDGPA